MIPKTFVRSSLVGVLILTWIMKATGQITHHIELDLPGFGMPVGEFRQNTKSVVFGTGARIVVQAFGKKSPIYLGPEFRWEHYGRRKFVMEYPLLNMADKIRISNQYSTWNAVARFQDPTPKYYPFPFIDMLVGVKTMRNKVSIDNTLYGNDAPYTKTKHSSTGLNLGLGVGLSHIVFNDLIVMSIQAQYLTGTKLKYVDQASIVLNPNTGTYDPDNYEVSFKRTPTNQFFINLIFVIESDVKKWWD